MAAAPETGGGPMLEFADHRSIVPTLAVLLALAILETIVVYVVAVALRPSGGSDGRG